MIQILAVLTVEAVSIEELQILIRALCRGRAPDPDLGRAHRRGLEHQGRNPLLRRPHGTRSHDAPRRTNLPQDF